MTHRQILLNAARLIDERGLAQAYYATPAGSLCTVAAIRVASGGWKVTHHHDESFIDPTWAPGDYNIHDNPHPAWEAEEMVERVVCPGGDLVTWSDHTGRTASDVTRALRTTAGLIALGKVRP